MPKNDSVWRLTVKLYTSGGRERGTRSGKKLLVSGVENRGCVKVGKWHGLAGRERSRIYCQLSRKIAVPGVNVNVDVLATDIPFGEIFVAVMSDQPFQPGTLFNKLY